jgi:hypothetical protein
MIIRLVAAAAALVALLGFSGGPAFAEIVVDGTSADASLSEGTYSAEISLLNTSKRDVTLPEQVALTDSCNAKVKDRTIGGLRSVSVTLTFDDSCFGDADSLEADLDDAGPLPAVAINKPTNGHAWLPMGISAVIALVVAIVVGAVGVGMLQKVDSERKARNDPTSGEGAKRKASYDSVKVLVNERVAQLTPTSGLSWKSTLPAPDDYTLTSEVKGLEAGWSFKDSWAANLTVATTAFVALLSSADTLTAVLGEKPEAALGVMTVAGLISAVIIAVANTIAKLVGDTTSKVTTGGLILSTSLVVFAAGLQTGTVGGTAMTLVEGWLAQGLVILLSLGVGAVLVWYALATTYSTLQTGAPDDPLPVIPADAVEAWNVSDPWQVAIVKNRILTTYAEWLTTPAPALAVAAYPATPMLVLGTSPGDDLYQPTRASLI